MGYLDTQFSRFKREWPGTERVGILRDNFGAYAFEIKRPNGKRYYFCAKGSQNGGEISMHADLVHKSNMTQAPIVLMLKGGAYLYYGNDILRSKPWKNQHNGASMLNFPMNIGRNLKLIGTGAKLSTPEDVQTLMEHPVGLALVEELGLEAVQA